MTLADTWRRYVLGAAGASLLVPIAVLLAAGVLAAGTGLGGLSSLGQLTSGPALPAPHGEGTSSLAEADIVGADLSSPAADAAASGASPGAPGAAGVPGVGGGEGLPSPLAETAPVGGGVEGGEGFTPPPGGGSLEPVPDGSAPPGGAPVAPTAPGGAGGGLVDELTQPIAPVTDALMDLLDGPGA